MLEKEIELLAYINCPFVLQGGPFYSVEVILEDLFFLKLFCKVLSLKIIL